ncbi:outer membrane protein assembly factor BamA [Marinobacter bohaiensis]|uniref:outer membrane protein assembly factor BamA n=1 Tax=Marinobacter bohaiensis TaxID=2201898 RepID=UPI000DAC4EE4|nr:outer membrane protein assembly factor BamA [Marinobacter bohaiensis]
MRRSLLSVALGLMSTVGSLPPALADEFVVSDIEVEGLQRVSAGTVFGAFPVSIGEQVNEVTLADAIKNLFQTGLFTDLSASRDEDVLVLSVQERPAISSIDIEGNKAIETEMLTQALNSAGLTEGQVFKRATLERLELEILRSYVAQGRYNARVKATAQELPRNRVAVKLDINEGSVASIRHINIIGNDAFSDEELLDQFELETSDWWSSITSSDKYARERLSGDLETLRSWYFDRGYLDFNVESSQVSISPDKKDVFITLSINEGPKYTISEINLRGDLILKESELRELIKMKPGDVYSQQLVTSTSEALSRRLGREGYTFANVNARPEKSDDNTAAITFYVEPGNRAYVRRINFEGNVSTRDEVLRREMVQMEGGVASTDLIEYSKTKLERLGFFKTVDVETVRVPGEDDQIDVNYTVEEQPTGSLSASLGYSQSSGVILGASVSENNFFGTGKEVTIGATHSDSVKSAKFSYTNPYYTVDGVSRGFSIYARETDYDEEDISSYLLDEYGASLDFGYPIDSITRLNFGVGYTRTNIKLDEFPAQEVTEFIDEYGDSFNTYHLTGSWSRNSLNRGVLPTDGFSHSLSLDVAVPGSDQTYYKLTHRTNFFQPLNDAETWVFHTRTKIGYGDGYGDSSELPFYENYYAGGYGSVRGYEANSLGNLATNAAGDDSDPDPFGGNVLTEGSVELIFPTPFAGDTRSMRTAFFLDGGQVFDTARGYDPEAGELRFAAGIGFQWITAIGPLAFSLGEALNPGDDDETEIFQFSLGSSF